MSIWCAYVLASICASILSSSQSNISGISLASFSGLEGPIYIYTESSQIRSSAFNTKSSARCGPGIMDHSFWEPKSSGWLGLSSVGFTQRFSGIGWMPHGEWLGCLELLKDGERVAFRDGIPGEDLLRRRAMPMTRPRRCRSGY